jgi:hypothetical protein
MAPRLDPTVALERDRTGRVLVMWRSDRSS